MLRDCVCRTVKIGDGVAGFAPVLVRSGGKLSIVGVLVAILTGRELHFVYGLLAGRNVTLVAFHLGVHSQQGVLRRRVLLDSEQGWFPTVHVVTLGAFAFLRPVCKLPAVGVRFVTHRARLERDVLFKVAA